MTKMAAMPIYGKTLQKKFLRNRWTDFNEIWHEVLMGCVPLPEWTGMNIITGMDYRNGHYAVTLGALNVLSA